MKGSAKAACVLTVVACLATYAVINITGPNEEWIAEGTEQIYEHEIASFEQLAEGKKVHKKLPAGTTLKNLMDFKAFCMGAYTVSRAILLKYPKKGPGSAILEFIAQIGQSGHWEGNGDAKLPANIVTEYVEKMGQMKKENPKGVNAYLFDRLDDSILHGDGALKFLRSPNAFASSPWGDGVVVGPLVQLNKEAVGLQVDPSFVKELAQSISDFDVNRAKVEAKCGGADVLASAMFYQKKGKGRYMSFYNREINWCYNKMMKEFHIVANYTLKAEKAKFAEVYEKNRKAVFEQVIQPTGAGYKAAFEKRKELNWSPPPLSVLKARAKAKAARWLKRYKAKLPKHGKGQTAALVKKMVDAMTGAKVYMKTGVLDKAQSTMAPKITIEGSARTIKGTIRAVAGAGETAIQHFASRKGIGHIKKVVLRGSGGKHSWFCQKISVRVGPSQMIYLSAGKNHANGFWLNGTGTVVLKPSKSLKADAKKLAATACIGFKATSGCNATGPRYPDDDEGCSAMIQGDQSGYCACGSGVVSRVSCGHASFRCKELCAAV